MTDENVKTKDANKSDKEESKPATSAKTVVDSKPVAESQLAPTVAASAQTQSAPIKSGGKGLSLFAILLSLLALGGSGYNLYMSEIQSKLDDAGLAVDMAQIGGQITRIGDSVKRLQDERSIVVSQEQLTTSLLESKSAVDLKFRDVKQQFQEAKQRQSELTTAFQKINDDLNSGVSDFVVNEVAQLLTLANNSALFSNDPSSAIKALQLADAQLKEMADPRYGAVRRKINEEIGILQSVEQIDIESVTVKLKTLANRIPSLKLENDTPVVGNVVVDALEQPQGFKANAKKMLSDLVDLVEVQRIDQAPKPLLVPEQRYFLDQNIQLQLAKAELGLLQQRASVYGQSLASASEMLKEYFDMRDAKVQDVMSQIEQLKGQSLGSQLPSISGSYSLLQSIKGGQ